ncbi:MAG: hypothetical protein AAF216_11075 [Pseudomonadota bacterium]
MIRSFVTGLILGVFTAPAVALTGAQLEQCQAMSATFETKQTEVLELQALQAELAATAEAAGEAWEDKEEFRLFSPAQAEEADAAKVVFETAKSEAMRAAMDLRSKAQMLNADIAQYNARCAADN